MVKDGNKNSDRLMSLDALQVHDPEGILSTFPAIATALFGAITGDFLSKPYQAVSKMKKFYNLFVASLGSLVIVYLWGQIFP